LGKPIILTVDDEEQVRNAVERDLRRQYRKDYRVIKTSSGAEALETTEQLLGRNEVVALFLADQRMPGMSGTEFLGRAMQVFPEARKVLLTAYADTEAAIQAINEVGIDHYLMKPWEPPEEKLYPVLDDLLADWHATAPLPFEGIRVAGTLWSPSSHLVKDFLARSQISYQWSDIERDETTRRQVEAVLAEKGETKRRLPVLFFPDGGVMVEPTLAQLAEKVGQRTRASGASYDLVVVGAGPAGLAAAVYGASEGLTTLLIDKETTGGQAGTSSRIENYLGFPKGLSGADLARRATVQARRLGAEILTAQEVTSIRAEGNLRIATLADGSEVSCKALVLATGVAVRRLDLPGVERLTGAGVYYGAALSEAASYRDRRVFVVGGANSAGQGAIFLAGYASQVTMLVRSSLASSMSRYLIDQIEATQNIEVLLRSEVREVHGRESVEAITFSDCETGETRTVDTPAVFVFIGATPHTDLVKGVVKLSEAGFVLTGNDLVVQNMRPAGWRLDRYPFDMETSVPGVFAAGDVRHGVVRRVASAVGQGAAVVSLVHEYLKTI
jgi:thioredoxin reductase (NADPH)